MISAVPNVTPNLVTAPAVVVPPPPPVAGPAGVGEARVDLGNHDEAPMNNYERLQEILDSELRLSFTHLLQLVMG